VSSDADDPPRGAGRDTGYRKNQLSAGVTMVQVKRRFAAVRIRPGAVTLRTVVDGPWVPISVEQVGRARRPWVVRLTLTDGTSMYVRPFLPGEAGPPDCGSRVGGIGDSAPLGDDPISAVIAVFAIVFYVLAAPFFVVANWRRTTAARHLRQDLDRALGTAAGVRQDKSTG
jgi:hypothetical protein